MKSVSIAGNPNFQVDPRREDFFRRCVELRKEVEALAAATSDAAEKVRLKAEALALKIVANATSYGGFVELNVQEHSKPKTLAIHSGVGAYFEYAIQNEEKPGRYSTRCSPP